MVRPLLLIGLAVVAVEAVLLVTDTGPDVWLVAAIVLAIGAGTWMAASTAGSVARPATAPAVQQPSAERPDLRTSALRQAVSGSGTDVRHAERVRRQLVDLVDDHLADVHGIDRATEPERARDVLGPELARFVDEDAPTALTARRLDRIVGIIERI